MLRKIQGCAIPEGATSGKTDINGNRYADCHLGGTSKDAQADVTVRTYPGDPRVLDRQRMVSDDGRKFIIGADFVVILFGDFTSYSRKVDVAGIARQVGGNVT